MLSKLFEFVVLLAVAFASNQAVGQLNEENASDPKYMEMAWKAAKMVNDDASNVGPYKMIPIEVLKAESQLVSGSKYILDVLYGESTCRKGDFRSFNLSSMNCPLKSDGMRDHYEVEVWEQPWEGIEQISVKKLSDDAAEETP